jgi:hypothetical protein
MHSNVEVPTPRQVLQTAKNPVYYCLCLFISLLISQKVLR